MNAVELNIRDTMLVARVALIQTRLSTALFSSLVQRGILSPREAADIMRENAGLLDSEEPSDLVETYRQHFAMAVKELEELRPRL